MRIGPGMILDHDIHILDNSLKGELEKIDEKSIFKGLVPTHFIKNFNTSVKMVSFFENLRQNPEKILDTKIDDFTSSHRIDYPYIQITKKGLLKSTIDFFPVLKQNPKFYKIDKKYWKDFKEKYLYAIHEKPKLNGVKILTEENIQFFNGERYYFNNIERSSDFSLGLLLDKNRNLVFSYWSKFMSKSRLFLFPKINVNEDSEKKIEKFKKMVKLNKHLLKLKLDQIDNLNKRKVYFSAKWHMDPKVNSIDFEDDNFCYSGEWFDAKPFGNGVLSWKDKENGNDVSVRGFWFDNQIYSDSYFNSEEFKILISNFEKNKIGKKFFFYI